VILEILIWGCATVTLVSGMWLSVVRCLLCLAKKIKKSDSQSAFCLRNFFLFFGRVPLHFCQRSKTPTQKMQAGQAFRFNLLFRYATQKDFHYNPSRKPKGKKLAPNIFGAKIITVYK